MILFGMGFVAGLIVSFVASFFIIKHGVILPW